LNITIPENARIIRNLITGIQYVQDHVIHFYHLHALDWVNVVTALSADPKATAKLAHDVGKAYAIGGPWPNNSTDYFAGVKAKLKEFVDRGQLGPFANAYWGHKAYKLPAEANLMAVAHYLEALEWQKDVIRMHATLGAKNPHLQTYVVGGVSVPVDGNSQNALNTGSIAFFLELAKKAQKFVEQVYLPDLIAVASFYKDWAAHGAGVLNYLTCGEFPLDGAPNTNNYWLPSGVIKGGKLEAHDFDPTDAKKMVAEHIAHSWYTGADSKHPYDGETNPNYTGPKSPYKELDTNAKYSWIKAPRYEGLPMEVGPLSRMLVAYLRGHEQVKATVDYVLKKLDVPVTALLSTLGRTGARCVETVVIAQKLPEMITELAGSIKKNDTQICANDKWDPDSWPREAQGVGWHEAPRGALSHWINIKDKKIANYQCVVPSTWNGSPRDEKGQRGPYEQALVGTPVANIEEPLEILRTVHSFDPCMACAVHVVDAEGKPVTRIKVV
jgi:[NiFe] hydrogenase large subunit/hydrogenase large subunit